MLKASGGKVFVGGNIGTPLIGLVGGDWEWGVVEVSSFQLEWIEEFRPRISVLLNLTEDHLDRYPNFRAYCQATQGIFEAQAENDIAILSRDDRLVWEMRKRIGARVVAFGFSEVDDGAFVAAHEMLWRGGAREEDGPVAR